MSQLTPAICKPSGARRQMAEQIETSLELVGATAIEDKLQESGWPKLRPSKVAACCGGPAMEL